MDLCEFEFLPKSTLIYMYWLKRINTFLPNVKPHLKIIICCILRFRSVMLSCHSCHCTWKMFGSGSSFSVWRLYIWETVARRWRWSIDLQMDLKSSCPEMRASVSLKSKCSCWNVSETCRLRMTGFLVLRLEMKSYSEFHEWMSNEVVIL